MGDTLALNAVHVGDIRDLAPRIAPGSVNCIVTSPPYFGLRDYGTARWEGGDAGCDHAKPSRQGDKATLGPGGTQHHPYPAKGDAPKDYYRDRCGRCGAVRVDRQLGLEPTVGEFVANLVAVFRALRPALRDDGTLWVNLGDSYSTGGNGGGGTCKQASNRGSHLPPKHTPGLPPKCLTLAPARFAIAMVEDGWVLRNDIIWHKPNPIPESVTDRFTTSHEHVFLFAKNPRYWADMEAVREPSSQGTQERYEYRFGGNKGDADRTMIGYPAGDLSHLTGRNPRDVWTLPTAGFPGSHYATFPPDLARRCIRAGCPPRVCARCGAPWVRVVEREGETSRERLRDRGASDYANAQPHAAQGLDYAGAHGDNLRAATMLGWRPTCACGPDAGTRPGVVLDPFVGSGTTVAVAVEEGRDWLAVDLDERSIRWTAERLARVQIRLPLDLAGEAAGG